MKAAALSSGSSGNCFYVEDNEHAVLIDLGISFKQLNERLEKIKRSPEKIRAIFVTHEHIDHIRGIETFSRNFDVPIFLTKETAKNTFISSNENCLNFIKNNETISINGLDINAFAKSHDCENPVSYRIDSKKNNKSLTIATDIGYPCRNVMENVSDSDFLFFESNHDEEMLKNGPYPYFLKKRILSDRGHLSNIQSSLCVIQNARKKLKHVVLSHLSENNNTPELALKTYKKVLKARNDLKPIPRNSQGDIPSNKTNAPDFVLPFSQ